MGWSRPDEESRADYYRDSHKADWRDERPHAHETVLLIKAVDFKTALQLLEAYADSKAAAIRPDAVRAGAQS